MIMDWKMIGRIMMGAGAVSFAGGLGIELVTPCKGRARGC